MNELPPGTHGYNPNVFNEFRESIPVAVYFPEEQKASIFIDQDHAQRFFVKKDGKAVVRDDLDEVDQQIIFQEVNSLLLILENQGMEPIKTIDFHVAQEDSINDVHLFGDYN